MIVLGDRAFKEKNNLKWGLMTLIRWTLTQYDWCLYNTSKFRHRQVQREGHVKTQWENSSSINQGERSPKKPAPSHVDFGHLASRTMGKKILLFKPPSVWFFFMTALENYYQYENKFSKTCMYACTFFVNIWNMAPILWMCTYISIKVLKLRMPRC